MKKKNPITRAVDVVKSIRHRIAEPLRLELSIVDHCNLNCKGCTHYCPVAPEHVMDADRLDSNLGRLAAVDSRMFHDIYILGGEPLLHPELPRIIRMVRRHFPDTVIKLLTNGIRIPMMPADFWDACRETRTVVSATIYPVKVDYAAIERQCEREGVAYEIFHQPKDGLFFSKHTIDDRKPGNRYINFVRCHQVGCLTLRGDRIYPCSTSAYADLINRAFGRDFVQSDADSVAVDAVTSARQLERLKLRPTPFCRYCTAITPTQWACSRREPTEWLP